MGRGRRTDRCRRPELNRRTDGDRANQDRTDRDRVDQDRIDQGRIDQGRIDQDRVNQDRADQYRIGQNRTGRSRGWSFATALCLTAVLSLLCACHRGEILREPEPDETSDAVTFTDDLGYTVTVTSPEKTAVLSGSYADMWQLAGGKIAAVTQDAADTIEITEDMVNLGDLKKPGIETMIAEEIDFVILSSIIAEHVALRDKLEAAGITTAYFEVESFGDYADMMSILTEITGRRDLYEENVTALRTKIDAQIARADGSNPRVLLLRAYSGGVKSRDSTSMTGQMLKDLGSINIADSEKGLLENLSMEAIIAEDPDFIFVTTMGESQEAALKMVEELLISNPAWSGLKAIREDHYYVLPKELFHIKPNNRWAESYQILADYLYGGE